MAARIGGSGSVARSALCSEGSLAGSPLVAPTARGAPPTQKMKLSTFVFGVQGPRGDPLEHAGEGNRRRCVVFSVPNPVTDRPHRVWRRDPHGKKTALEIDRDFDAPAELLQWKMER